MTFVGFLVNFWLNASEMLWAGSVLRIKTVSRTLDKSEAKLELKSFKEMKWNEFEMIWWIKPACCFSNTTFSSNKYPFETCLLDYCSKTCFSNIRNDSDRWWSHFLNQWITSNYDHFTLDFSSLLSKYDAQINIRW